MPDGRLEAYNRYTGIFDERSYDFIGIVLGFILEAGERTHPYNVCVLADDARRFADVLCGVAVHHYAVFKLQSPALGSIHADDLHTELLGCRFGAQPGAQAGVKKQHDEALVPAQLLKCVWVCLDSEGFFY